MRDKLNNLRNSFTYLANFLLLIVALIVFSFLEYQRYKILIIIDF